MKNSLYLALITLVLTACGGSNQGSLDNLIAEGDLDALRTKKKEISDQQKALVKDIATLDSVIALKSGIERLPLVSTLTVKAEQFDHYLELQGCSYLS